MRFKFGSEHAWPLFVFVGMICIAGGLNVATAQTPTQLIDAPTSDEGFTEPFRTVVVAAADSGVLKSLRVREGDRVRKGEVIAKLNSDVLAASANAARDKQKAQGKLNGAQATLRNKTNHLKQMQELLANKHASAQEVQLAQLEYEVALANVEVANDELRAQAMEIKTIEAQLERRIIRAPCDGVILELPRQVGEAITSVESQVATIVALDQLRVRYFLSTAQASRLRPGASVVVDFPDTNQQAQARVDFVSPVTDSKSGTVRVELLIANNNEKFRSGLRCVLDSRSANTADARLIRPTSNQAKRE